jgi:hypothetical protein
VNKEFLESPPNGTSTDWLQNASYVAIVAARGYQKISEDIDLKTVKKSEKEKLSAEAKLMMSC